MATKAVFEADFESFYDAVDKADAKLKAFDSQTSTVSKSLTDMVNALSPVEAIREATLMAEAIERIGGASKLTTDQLKEAQAVFDRAFEGASKWGMELPAAIDKTSTEVAALRTSWNSFLESFDVEKAIKHPLETATEGMLAFANSIGPAGQEAILATGLVAALGAEAYKLASNAAEVGERFSDMAEKTGLSVSQLSRYSNALQVAGGDLGTVTNALYTFERGAAKGSDTFVAGLKAIGLSLDEVRRMNPDQYLDAIAAGFDGLDDPISRATTAQALFGRQGRELLPTLNDLAAGMRRTADIQPITNEQSAAAKEFQMNVRSLETHIESLGIAFGNKLIPAINATMDELKNLEPVWDKMNAWAQKVSDTLDYLATGKWPEATKAAKDHSTALADAIAAEQAYNAALKEHSDRQNELNKQWAEWTTAEDKRNAAAQAAAEKYAAALTTLKIASEGLQGVQSTLNENQIAAIKHYLDLGVSLDTLATAYKVNIEQIKLIAESKKAETDATKAEQSAVEEATKLWDNYYKTISAEDKSTVQGQIANIWAWAQAQYDALDKSKKWSQDAADAITATANAQAEQAKRLDMEKDKYAQQYYAKQAADAHAHLDAVQADWTNHTMAEIDLLQKQADAADDALGHWQDAATAAMDNAQPPVQATTQALQGLSAAANQAAQAIAGVPNATSSASWKDPRTGLTQSWDWLMQGQGLGGGTRAAGGPVDAGVPYLVGERGPELFVPSASGTIVPNGAGNTNIQNTFHLVDTESNLARRVAETIMQSIRNGVRL